MTRGCDINIAFVVSRREKKILRMLRTQALMFRRLTKSLEVYTRA